MSEDMRPPSDRMSLCGERHWCLKCAAQIKVIGNGWHVQAAAKILESVLRAVAKAKLGDHTVKVHDFAAHETHECKAQCRHRIKLKEVKRLLAAGAPVNTRDNNHITPLMAASLRGEREIVKLLLAHGADVNARTTDGQTALIYASIKGDREVVEMLLANGSAVNLKDKSGDTALSLATRMKHPEVKELLVKAGAK